MTGDAESPDQVIWVAYDITERKRTEAALEQRDQLLQGVSRASSLLLGVRDMQEAVERALQAIGEHAQVDRVTIFENTFDLEGNQMNPKVRYGWARPGFEFDSSQMPSKCWTAKCATGTTNSPLTGSSRRLCGSWSRS